MIPEGLYYYEGTEVIKITRIVKDELNGVVVYSMNDVVDSFTPKTYTWYDVNRITPSLDSAINSCIKRRIESAKHTIQRCRENIEKEQEWIESYPQYAI